MSIKEYIQLGDEKQCLDNGIFGYQYMFGFSDPTKRHTSHYICKSLNEEIEDGDTVRWLINDEYRTNFKLVLFY